MSHFLLSALAELASLWCFRGGCTVPFSAQSTSSIGLAPGSWLFLLYLWVDMGVFDHPGLLQHYELSNRSGCSGYKSGSHTVLCWRCFDVWGKGGGQDGGTDWCMVCTAQTPVRLYLPALAVPEIQLQGVFLGALAELHGDKRLSLEMEDCLFPEINGR